MNMDYSLEIKKDIKILIVEDSETDADLIVRYLKKSGMLFISKVVESRKAFEQALDTFCPDIVLSDYSLPAFDAISAFTLTKEKKTKNTSYNSFRYNWRGKCCNAHKARGY
jgi:CheY-like chemotaxis protein